jgi:hypothetical protein
LEYIPQDAYNLHQRLVHTQVTTRWLGIETEKNRTDRDLILYSAQPMANPEMASASSSPRVSVIVAVFNGQSTIADALTSALSQDFQQAEVIVTNDGSTDRTASIFADFGSAIKVIDQSHRGVSAARTSAPRASRGEYLAFLDADDVWLAGRNPSAAAGIHALSLSSGTKAAPNQWAFHDAAISGKASTPPLRSS